MLASQSEYEEREREERRKGKRKRRSEGPHSVSGLLNTLRYVARLDVSDAVGSVDVGASAVQGDHATVR